MARIFLCYARTDEAFALPLARVLKEHGADVWIDQWDIPGGADWDKSIDDALYSCAQLLIVLSPQAVASPEVRAELRTALNQGKPVVPVLYKRCNVPRQLNLIQYIDYTSRGADDETAIGELLRALDISTVPRPKSNATLQESTESEVLPKHGLASPADEELSDSHSCEGGTPQEGVNQQTREQLNEQQAPKLTLPPTFTNSMSPSIGMEFVLIPAGEFLMGRSRRQVTITQPFYLGKYPVTQAQWTAVMGRNPSSHTSWFKDTSNQPVEQVSWDDVQEFIRKLNEREGGSKYRLPTAAEWEYAARAGSTTAYSFGDDPEQLDEYAWYISNSGSKTHSVGQKKPNAWGLYDMHGNVWEWVQDWHGKYPSEPMTDPQGPASGSYRVYRGGSWYDDAGDCRSAYRPGWPPGTRNGYLGFRLLRTAP
jgi:formylglycine-generating enzyme required for sulfatase activity